MITLALEKFSVFGSHFNWKRKLFCIGLNLSITNIVAGSALDSDKSFSKNHQKTLRKRIFIIQERERVRMGLGDAFLGVECNGLEFPGHTYY